ncbi:MAG: response regulator, partial [Pseudomonas sp.]|uniref:response regulator n=1 Tax=Pseudomonas sp. TaxID=306 RepID=UPI0030F2B376
LTLPKAREDAEDQPQAPLLGRTVAVVEQHELARQALQHQLEDCGLLVVHHQNLDSLLSAVSTQQYTVNPISLAVLGVTSQELPPEQLSQRVWDLERIGCKSLVLCPTTEQALYHESLPDAHSQLQAKPACTRKVQRALIELLGPRHQPSEVSHPTQVSRPPKILCVDDNPANLKLVHTLLSDMGAEVTAVDSGFAAVDVVKHKTFDLIFMDVQMPGMDGRQATEQIRHWEAEQEAVPTPIIALTAHALANEKRALLQGGMDDYLTKPISERQLAQVVLKWTGLALRNAGIDRPTEAPQAQPQPTQKVLDEEEGLRLAAGKADLAADMLSMLLASLDGDRETIRQARDNDDRNALIERVHRLHGATRYCGVPQLRAICQRTETLLKQDDPAYREALDELDAAMLRLADIAKLSA